MPVRETGYDQGGSRGIGAATAELFAGEGARVIVADVAEEVGRSLVAQLGPQHRFVRLDVSNQDEWTRHLPGILPEGSSISRFSMPAS